MFFRTIVLACLANLFCTTSYAAEKLYSSIYDSLPTFSADYYLKANPDVAQVYGANNYWGARQHWDWKGKSEGRASSASFHVRDYLELHADLSNAYGTNYLSAIWHFENFGINEGRQSTHAFAVKEYRALHPQILDAWGVDDNLKAFNHWALTGINWGLQSMNRFDVAQYLDAHQDLQSWFGIGGFADAYLHWLQDGRINGRYDGISKRIPACSGPPRLKAGSRSLSARIGGVDSTQLFTTDAVTAIGNKWNSFGFSSFFFESFINPTNPRLISIVMALDLQPDLVPGTGSWYFTMENDCGITAISGDITVLPQSANSSNGGGGQQCNSVDYLAGSTTVPRGGSTVFTLSGNASSVDVFNNGSGVTASVNNNQLTITAPANSNGSWYTVYPVNACGENSSISGSIQ